jgi:lipoprotein-releasing system permease protein
MYKIILATRYLLKRRITYFGILAVALCVFIVVVVMTVMAGLVNEFKEKNHRFAGDCVVGTESLVGFAYYEDFAKLLEQQDFVKAVSPAIKSFALKRRRGSDQDDIVEVTGIDPVKHSQATGFGDSLYYHRNDVSRAFNITNDANLVGCVLGDYVLLQDTYNRNLSETNIPRIAYSISCFPLTARGALAQAGTDMVNTKTFYFSDQSSSGLPRVDGSVVYLPFEQAQALCGMDGSPKRASRLHIKFKPGVKIPAGCEKVQSLWQKFRQDKSDEAQSYTLDTVSVQSWKQYRRESIAPMENEQTEMSVMFGFVGITTVFIVLVVFYMIISHKSKDIGILKSIGVSNIDIIELFSGYAFLVGIIGAGIGLLTGWIFLLKINQIEDWLYEHYGFQLWDRTIYAIGDIPNKVDFKILATIAISAIVACLAGALIPTLQAARQRPAETLQVGQL